jgi:hypothetical protein
MRYGEFSGHHRGLRAEHVFKGVARELERANCLLIQPNRIRYRGRIAKSEQTRDGLLAVLVDHSTDVGTLVVAVRWGSETQATHRREGEAGYNDLWNERRVGLRAHEPCHRTFRECVQRGSV